MHGLTKKQITDKNGKITTVWVKTGQKPSGGENKGTDQTGMIGPLLKQYGHKFTDEQKKKMQSSTAKMYETSEGMTVYEGDKKIVSFKHSDLKKEGDQSEHSEAKVEGIKGQFLRAKNAYNGAENDADKKKAAEALQKFHEQLRDAGVHKEGGDPFWKKDLKEGSGKPKTYKVNPAIGKVKHSISYHDGVKTHDDGSAFNDIQTFKNKKDLAAYEAKLKQDGYKG